MSDSNGHVNGQAQGPEPMWVRVDVLGGKREDGTYPVAVQFGGLELVEVVSVLAASTVAMAEFVRGEQGG